MERFLPWSDQLSKLIAFGIANTNAAQEVLDLLYPRLEECERVPRIGVPEPSQYLRFTLTWRNMLEIRSIFNPELEGALFFPCQTPEMWWEWKVDYVLLRFFNYWLELDPSVVPNFIDDRKAHEPRLTSLPFARNVKRRPAKGISTCYYEPYYIAHVPTLKKWLIEMKCNLRVVPFCMSGKEMEAVYSAHPDADRMCASGLGWSLEDEVWNICDYALLVPESFTSLSGSFTLFDSQRVAEEDQKDDFRPELILGLPIVSRSKSIELTSFLPKEHYSASGNPDTCFRDLIIPKQEAKRLWDSLSKGQQKMCKVLPVFEV